MNSTRSPLIWFGGKGKVAQHIIRHFPPHSCYVEPFGGAAHVIIQKQRSNHEVYNDIDGNVVNFLMMVRDFPNEMTEACESLPYSRELYETWKKGPLPEDKFARAVRWFYMNRSGISQGNRQEIAQTGWRHTTKSNQNVASGYVNACRLFKAVSERMKGVMIERSDFRTIFEKYDDKDTLFYVDPPYIGREYNYAGEFTEQDHRELAEILGNVKGKAVLSYYSDPMVDELYAGWTQETYEAFKQVVNGPTGKYAEELLLMNFDNGQLTLF